MTHIKLPLGPVLGTAEITVLVTFWLSAAECSPENVVYVVLSKSEYEESNISDVASEIQRKTLKITERITNNLLMKE